MSARRAVSLIELLVVMSACTVILTLSAALMHRGMRAQSESRAFFDMERSGLRLADQFRQDVQRAHAAVSEQAELPEGVLLQLRLGEHQTVEYGQESETVIRKVLELDKLVARDEFAFRSSIELAISRQDAPSLISLFVTSSQASPDGYLASVARALPVHLQVAARLGRDVRFAPLPPTSKEVP